ncbi:MAG TPA: hypothetical protein VGF95_16130 [Solirubrobacteraceae bacterium]|jgi:hypothetical protein
MATAATTSEKSATAAKAKRASSAGATTRRSTTKAKASSARNTNANRSRTTKSRTTASSQTRTGAVGTYAEKAVLIPVGAALIARERLVDGVSTIVSDYSSPSAAQAQLNKFERRGHTARSRLEREARRTQVRLERELRRRKRGLDKAVGDLDRRRETLAKNITDQVDQTSTSIEARIKEGSELAGKLQDRIKEIAA